MESLRKASPTLPGESMSLPSFNVLSPLQSIEGHLLLEASAGTGKTFAIENIVVRSILEKKLSLDRILVLTFTNAATNDLKSRIRSCLAKAIDILTLGEERETYLASIIEQGQDAVWQAKQRLRHNLFFFENSQIFTLHGFCSRTLIELSFLDPQEWALSKKEIKEFILDYIRTSLSLPLIHPVELSLLWNAVRSTEAVVIKMQDQILKGEKIARLPTYAAGEEAFNLLVNAEREKCKYTTAKVIEDFQKLAKLCGKKPPTIIPRTAEIRNFARLLEEGPTKVPFSLIIEEGLVWTTYLDYESVYVKRNIDFSIFNYPQLDLWIRDKLEPLLRNHIDSDVLLLRIAAGAQDVLRKWMRAEYRSTHDDLLKLMVEKSRDPVIGDQIRVKYDLVIVDEFQDTDPSQWTILKKLFLDNDYPWNGQLVLVGDPKQSIYAFRQADIYTYREASHALGQKAMASLDTNFRSHPKLVQGLNLLFNAEKLPKLIYLPDTNETVYCNPVMAGLKEEELVLLPEEEIGIEFVVSESADTINEYIAKEIVRLKEEHGVSPHHCAILIKDHRRGAVLAKVLKKYGISYKLQKDQSLVESPAYSPLKQLLNAILHCRDLGIVKVALGDKILNWNYQQILQLNDPSLLASTLQMFAQWNTTLHTQGIAHCLQAVLDEPILHDSHTYGEAILKREEGTQFFLELFQLVELLLEHQPLGTKGQSGLLDLFETLEEINAEDSNEVVVQGEESQGVTIVTIHSSKGLEFDVVFAQGVAFPTPEPSTIIVKHENEERVIKAVAPHSEAYVRYCEEMDAEKMRQFYVTATRAKYKLYLFAQEKIKKSNKGRASIIDLYLSHLQGNEKDYETLYGGIESTRSEGIPALVKRLDAEGDKISCKIVKETDSLDSVKLKEESQHFQLDIIEKAPPVFNFTSAFVSSYSALAKHETDILENIPPSDWNAPQKTVHTLPAGAEIGLLFHALLENIDLSSDITLEEIIPYLTVKAEPWKYVIHELLRDLQKASLPTHDKSFTIKDIKPQSFYKETEFLYSSPRYGILKGVIDFCFEYDNKYYLLDWKTNWLGPSSDYYAPPNLQQAMQRNDYFLQAEIYMDALKRYFSLVDKRPFSECFGGYYYLFLRGIPSGHGIYADINSVG